MEIWHVYGMCWVLPYTDYTEVDSAIDEEWKHDVLLATYEYTLHIPLVIQRNELECD